MKKNIIDRIDIIKDDITVLKVDAIVNAANNTLLGGGGVDGAIHRAAGPELLAECREIGWCPTGDARITNGYKLPARHVIHTVGPVFSKRAEDHILLSNCYRNCLETAVKHLVSTIAFPAISCGVYAYPIEDACKVAVDTTCAFLETDNSLTKVIFVLFSSDSFRSYENYIRKSSP